MPITTFWNNPLGDWFIAVGIALGVALALLLARSIARKFLGHLTARPGSRVPPIALALSDKASLIFAVVVGLYLGSLVLDLPPDADDVTEAVVVLALLGWAGAWGSALIVGWTRQRQHLEERPETVSTLIAFRFMGRLALWSLLFLAALENLGVDITALVAGLGITGIAVALAAQSTLGDLFASIAILLDRPFVIGDFIIVGDLLGTVEHIGIKTTRVRSLWGEQLIFANSDLLSSRIRNYQRMEERRVQFGFAVTYQTAADQLEQIPGMIQAVIDRIERTRFDRAHFKAYGESGLEFEIVYYVLDADYNLYMDVEQAIHLALFRRFEEEGIQFAHPTRTLYLNVADSGTRPVVPVQPS